MTKTEETTLTSIAGLLISAIDHYGVNSSQVFSDAGIDIESATDPNGRLPVAKMQKVWSLAVEHTGDPCFGLTCASFIQPATLHGLGLAWVSSDTLMDSLQRLVRYQRIISTAMNFNLFEEDNMVTLGLPEDLGKFAVPASIDAGLAIFFQMCRITAGPELKPASVSIHHEAPPCRERFDDFYGIKVDFGAPTNAISFDKNDTEQPLQTANPTLARINDQAVLEYLKQFDKSDLLMQVRASIIEALPSGPPPAKDVATSLNMSLRNFQRRLKDEDTSYQKLLENIRKELAIQYLKESNRSIVEIGFLLGFSETSNFSRAFSRWMGVSPNNFRQGQTA